MYPLDIYWYLKKQFLLGSNDQASIKRFRSQLRFQELGKRNLQDKECMIRQPKLLLCLDRCRQDKVLG